MSLDMITHDDGTADITIVAAGRTFRVHVRTTDVYLQTTGELVTRFTVQPPGAEEPWSRHILPETAHIAALRRARRIERAYLKVERSALRSVM